MRVWGRWRQDYWTFSPLANNMAKFTVHRAPRLGDGTLPPYGTLHKQGWLISATGSSYSNQQWGTAKTQVPRLNPSTRQLESHLAYVISSSMINKYEELWITRYRKWCDHFSWVSMFFWDPDRYSVGSDYRLIEGGYAGPLAESAVLVGTDFDFVTVDFSLGHTNMLPQPVSIQKEDVTQFDRVGYKQAALGKCFEIH